MKIHIHTPSFFPALVGMTYATHVHALILRELGADVTVLSPTTEAISAPPTDAYEVRHFDISGSGLPWSPVRGDIDGIVGFTRGERPDIVMAEGWFTPGAALLPRLKAHCGHIVLSSHGSADLLLKALTARETFRSLSYRWVERREGARLIKLLSAAIVLTSYRDRDRFRDAAWFEARGVPVHVCPNTTTYAAPSLERDEDRRFAMLHVGELTVHKDQMLAVRILSTLPARFRLTLACPRWNDYGDAVMATADQLAVRDRITILEGCDREALEPVFEAHGLLLITSRSEAQPIIAVDALRKGMPFVSTRVGCMPEFGGGIVAGRDDLADAIIHLCSSPATYARFVHDAMQYHDTHLAWSKSRTVLNSMLSGLAN